MPCCGVGIFLVCGVSLPVGVANSYRIVNVLMMPWFSKCGGFLMSDTHFNNHLINGANEQVFPVGKKEERVNHSSPWNH